MDLEGKNESSVSKYNFSESDSIIPIVFICILICVIGIIGNSLVLFVITILKEYSRSVTHWYVLQLAIADSLFLLTIPFKVSEDLNHAWIYPEWMCKAKETVLFFNYYASILFLMVMSIDRYIAVCKTFSTRWQKLRSRNSAFIIAMVVWSVALLLTVPVMLYSFKSGQDPRCVCVYDFPSTKKVKEPCTQEKLSNDTKAYEICLRFAEFSKQRCINSSIFSEDVWSSGADYNSSYYETYVEEGSGVGNTKLYNYYDASATDPSAEIKTSSEIYRDKVNSLRTHTLNAECHYEGQSVYFIGFISFNFSVMFLFPLTVMVICYGLIIQRLFATRILSSIPTTSFTSTKGNGGTKQSHKRKTSARSDRDRKRVTFMCAALVSSFVICWLPYHALQIAKIRGIYDTKTEVCRLMLESGVIFVFLNSALNPYLYSFLGTSFSRRWKVATSSVRRSVSRRRTSSSGSVGGSTKLKSRQAGKTKLSRDKTTTTKLANNRMDLKQSASISESFPCGDTTINPVLIHEENNTLLVLSNGHSFQAAQ